MLWLKPLTNVEVVHIKMKHSDACQTQPSCGQLRGSARPSPSGFARFLNGRPSSASKISEFLVFRGVDRKVAFTSSLDLQGEGRLMGLESGGTKTGCYRVGWISLMRNKDREQTSLP